MEKPEPVVEEVSPFQIEITEKWNRISGCRYTGTFTGLTAPHRGPVQFMFIEDCDKFTVGDLLDVTF